MNHSRSPQTVADSESKMREASAHMNCNGNYLRNAHTIHSTDLVAVFV